MNLDIKKNSIKVLIDTNILVSALGFGGKPRQILLLILDRKIKAVTSPILFAEFHEIVSKKFPLLASQLELIENKLNKVFLKVNPKESINIVRDLDDNRVLEAASVGECQYIITGDKDLLDLKYYNKIIILTASDFLELIGTK